LGVGREAIPYWLAPTPPVIASGRRPRGNLDLCDSVTLHLCNFVPFFFFFPQFIAGVASVIAKPAT